MSLTNEQVVLSLIAFYKRNGADLTYLLSDPLFQSLPLEARVEAVKTHAKEILMHSKPGTLPEERAPVYAGMLGGGFTGLVAGLTAGGAAEKMLRLAGHDPTSIFANSALKNKTFSVVAGAGLATGVLLGGINSYMKAKADSSARKNLLKDLKATSVDPTLDNAIGVLSSHGQAQRSNSLRIALLNRISDLLESSKKPLYENALPKLYTDQYNIYANNQS
jgi:hypothetical protein